MQSAATLLNCQKTHCNLQRNNCMNPKKNKAVVANGKHLTWNQPVPHISITTTNGLVLVPP